MTQPLVIILYEKILPGTQLVNRMQDLGYRVLTLSKAADLIELARREKPMIVLADLVSRDHQVGDALRALRQDAETAHIPVMACAPDRDKRLQQAARDAGATLVVTESAILPHLGQFLDQALQVD